MGFSFKSLESDFSTEYITIRTAANFSVYHQQYLRRLLRENVFQSKRIGQLWLIDSNSFLDYLNHAKRANDRRFGPQ